MNARKTILVLIAAIAVPAVIFWGAHGSTARAASSSEQIVFSGGGTGTFVNPSTNSFAFTPFGFWIWCEDQSSSNPYHGECAGSMYFYNFGITRGVKGFVQENPAGTYTMSVVSTLDNAVSCALTASRSFSTGPTNAVSVVCGAPSGSGTAPNSVVSVTGP